MKKKEEKIPLGQFATALTEQLEDKGMSVMDLAKELGITYEHTRKMARSMAFPSRLRLNQISKVMGWKADDMWPLVVNDQIKKKYGKIPEELAGKTPEFTQIELLLPKITPEQFQAVLGMLEGWAKRNRKSA